jgi:transcriptional regulator with XRE-family HTH domain
MARNFKELRTKMSPERQARVEQKTRTLLNEMALNELREAISLTQESLADTLGLKQSAISKIEHRSDMYLSTLRKIIEAMGGELEIVAIMPDGRVSIKQFYRRERKEEVAAGDARAVALART